MSVGPHPGSVLSSWDLAVISVCFWPWALGHITLLQSLARTGSQDWLCSLRLALQSPLNPHLCRAVVVNLWSLFGLHA